MRGPNGEEMHADFTGMINPTLRRTNVSAWASAGTTSAAIATRRQNTMRIPKNGKRAV